MSMDVYADICCIPLSHKMPHSKACLKKVSKFIASLVTHYKYVYKVNQSRIISSQDFFLWCFAYCYEVFCLMEEVSSRPNICIHIVL